MLARLLILSLLAIVAPPGAAVIPQPASVVQLPGALYLPLPVAILAA